MMNNQTAIGPKCIYCGKGPNKRQGFYAGSYNLLREHTYLNKKGGSQ